MALSLATFIKRAKRKTRYGSVSTTTDLVTEDIVHYFNERCFKFWRRHPWWWIIKEFTIPIVATVVDYTLTDTEIGSIEAIDIGQGDYLRKITLKRYLQWFRGKTVSEDVGLGITHYVPMGRHATTKALKLKVWGTPAASATLTGWGKQRITRYTVADIATLTDIPYFPEEFLDVIMAGVIADIKEAQDKFAEALEKDRYFRSELDRAVIEDSKTETQAHKTPPPDYIIWSRRKRGGTTVV